MSFLIVLAALLVPSSPAAPFSLDDLTGLIRANSPPTLEAALSLLPRDFRRDPVLMRESRSLQFASAGVPRAILSNEDGSFLLAFNGGSNFEMIQYHRETRRFEFA